MKYENAGDVLPEHLLEEVKKQASGKLLYIPLNKERKAWGEVSAYRHYLIKRNQFIINMFQHGSEISELSHEFSLSQETIKRIVYSKKHRKRLIYYPTSRSAKKYAEAGMIEEWLHTYLLFDRCNKVFSDGLRLCLRYYIGPIMMPLSLFNRSSGPEEHMKWNIHSNVFESNVTYWVNKIQRKEELPPLIVNFENGQYEINCNNPLFESLVRSAVTEYPVIIWMTEAGDYNIFLENNSAYIYKFM